MPTLGAETSAVQIPMIKDSQGVRCSRAAPSRGHPLSMSSGAHSTPGLARRPAGTHTDPR